MKSITSDISQAEVSRRRSRLGSTLRDYRVERQRSGEELAKELEISQSKISRIETGRVTPSPRDIKNIAYALGLKPYEVDELVAEAQKIADYVKDLRREQARIGLAGLQSSHLLSESLYSVFSDFSLGVLPAWVQTPEYARSLLHALIPRPAGQQDIEQAVANRVARQAILRDANRTFNFVTTPDTLRAHWCDSEEMYVQLVHLRSLMRLPNVNLRVLDLSRPLSTVLLTNFTIYDQERVVVELLHTEIYVSDPTEVRDYQARFDALVSSTLSSADTAELIDSELTKLR